MKDIMTMFVEGAKSYIAILFIIASATAFGRCLTIMQYPQMVSTAILSTFSNKFAIILVMNVILLIFGMILDNIPNIMILTPILLPIAKTIGMDPVHFGIMMTCNLAIGMVTPPMGNQPVCGIRHDRSSSFETGESKCTVPDCLFHCPDADFLCSVDQPGSSVSIMILEKLCNILHKRKRGILL